jgi:hypothetical protein
MNPSVLQLKLMHTATHGCEELGIGESRGCEITSLDWAAEYQLNIERVSVGRRISEG